MENTEQLLEEIRQEYADYRIEAERKLDRARRNIETIMSARLGDLLAPFFEKAEESEANN